MMTRRCAMGLLGSGAAAILSGCGVVGANSYRFRMTVEVDTPEGLKTGSSVYEVKAWNTPKLLPEERARDWSVRGEAVAVDLPGGRTLFALLKTINPMREDLAQMSMAALDPAFRNDIVESAARIAGGQGIRSPAEVEVSDYPYLVTFIDMTSPESIVRINPVNTSATLGEGFRLSSIAVELVENEVTSGIIERLNWLKSHRGSLVSGERLNPTAPEKDFTISAFIQGSSK